MYNTEKLGSLCAAYAKRLDWVKGFWEAAARIRTAAAAKADAGVAASSMLHMYSDRPMAALPFGGLAVQQSLPNNCYWCCLLCAGVVGVLLLLCRACGAAAVAPHAMLRCLCCGWRVLACVCPCVWQ